MYLNEWLSFLGVYPGSPGLKDAAKKLDVNKWLKPLVDELKMLWVDGKMMYVDTFKEKQLVRVALIQVTADLKASHPLCGIVECNGIHGCSFCDIDFKVAPNKTKTGARGRNRFATKIDEYPRRNVTQHRVLANKYKGLLTEEARYFLFALTHIEPY